MGDSRKEQIAREMGSRIAQARRAAGFRTALEFASALGVSVWTVRSWESGKSQPRYEMLETITELVGRSRGWLLGEEPLRDKLDITIGDLLARPSAEGEAGLEAGVYGIPARNQAAEEALVGLSEAARKRGVLIRFGLPIAPATPEMIAALHIAVVGLTGRDED